MATRRHGAIEWPTAILAVVIHGGWLATTFFWAALPWPLLMLVGGWLVAWHGSLQHEVMHGHPTRHRRLNDLVGSAPLSLWLPYRLYKKSHMCHHRDESLTDPIEDPESAYLTGEVWARLGPVGRALARFNNTLLGRLALGPLVMILGFLASEAAALARGERWRLGVWVRHLASLLPVLAWLHLVCAMPLSVYALAFVYAGAALGRLRSFAEHRWSDAVAERTAVVERAGLFGLLFLNNNLHVLHHLRPAVPWYRLPELYRAEREALVRHNGGLVYDGYLDILRRFALRPHDEPLFPPLKATARETPAPDRAPAPFPRGLVPSLD
ncbi:aminotransferase [Aureimonas endophytica]|uniref:Aminotransferase n=1 Tax=Aureimonas endophytica TaxID=2027858 RepID=A0A916ZUJ1_9HYPH|nr:fatty acid desaturase [Aureimonas endophytica]GGE12186.1 aminotransferase [Aureimonas endophytica]